MLTNKRMLYWQWVLVAIETHSCFPAKISIFWLIFLREHRLKPNLLQFSHNIFCENIACLTVPWNPLERSLPAQRKTHIHLSGSRDDPNNVGADGDLQELVVRVVGRKNNVPICADFLLFADAESNEAVAVPSHRPYETTRTHAQIQHLGPRL